MIKNIFKKIMNNERAEINMIAIVLILIVVIILAIIFRDSMTELLNKVFERINQDVTNF